MGRYKVITDEKFFNEFEFMSERVRRLGGLFQNEGIETSSEEIKEWLKLYNDLLIELEFLKEDSIGRLESIE